MRSPAVPDRSRRWVLVAAIVVVCAGLVVRQVPGAVGDLGGGVLYTVLVGMVVLLVVPNARPVLAGAASLGVSSAVELLQLTPLPRAIAAEIPAARWVLGSTFAATDFLAYVLGGALLAGALELRDRESRRRELRRRLS